MELSFDCLPCALASFTSKLDRFEVEDEVKEEAVRAFLKHMACFDYRLTPPELGKQITETMKAILNNPDPYADEKNHYNELILGKYSSLKEAINTSDDPFHTAAKYCLAGNIIDFGPNLEAEMDSLLKKAINIDPVIDRSAELREELTSAKTLLYLGDNCGEVIFDMLFVELLKEKFPNLDITFAVRGLPVLNDATREDAEKIGLTKLVNVIDNGDASPGTILSNCSEEFLSYYNSADVIIAKGQGNFESLSQENKNIYYCLITKCDLVANQLNVKKFDTVIAKQNDIITK